MATASQRASARRNVKKAATTARRKRTIAHLSQRTKTALGKQGAKSQPETSCFRLKRTRAAFVGGRHNAYRRTGTVAASGLGRGAGDWRLLTTEVLQ